VENILARAIEGSNGCQIGLPCGIGMMSEMQEPWHPRGWRGGASMMRESTKHIKDIIDA
jgi:hypothetical protein